MSFLIKPLFSIVSLSQQTRSRLGGLLALALILGPIAPLLAQPAKPVAKPPAAQPVPQPGPKPGPALTGQALQLNRALEEQYAQGKFEEALVTLKSLLDYYRQQKNTLDEAETHNRIGLVYDRTQKIDQAVEAYRQALKLYEGVRATKPAEAKDGEARTLNNIGALYAGADRVDDALGFMERALGLFKEIKATSSVSTTLRNLGTLYLKKQRLPDAIKAFESSLALEQQLGRVEQLVSILDRLSSLYAGAGALPQSLQALQQALAIVQKSGGDSEAQLALLGRIGQLYDEGGAPAKAAETYQAAIALLKKIVTSDPKTSKVREASLLMRLAGAQSSPQSLETYKQALTIVQTLASPIDEARILINMADLQRRNQQWPGALRDYQAALPLTQKAKSPILEGRTLASVAIVQQELGQLDAAIATAQKALVVQRQKLDSPEQQASQKVAEAITLNSLGDLYRSRQQFDTAAIAYQDSLTALGAQGDPLLQGTNLTYLGEALVKLGKPKEATKALADAVTLWDAIGLASSQGIAGDSVALSYQLLQEALIRQSQPEAALIVAEQERSRRLRTYQTLRTGGKTPIPPPDLPQIKQAAASQNATLVFYALATIDDPKDPKAKDSKAKPAAKPATKSTSELRIWVVSPSGSVQLKRVETTENLAELARASRDVGTAESLKPLSQLLLAPIADLLPKEGRLILVPPEVLRQIPIAALQTPDGEALVDRPFTIVPAIQTLLRAPRAASPGKPVKALIVGNPKVSGGRDRPITREEATAIGTLLNIPALTDAKASRTEVAKTLTQAGLIHLAVPYLDVQDIGEALAFAADKDLQGITAADILSLNFQAKLVVLHGLELGETMPRRELLLPQAFLAADVPRVMTSVAAVSDGAARDLFKAFYASLEAQGDADVALRKAMVVVRSKYPNPKDWAGFVLMGGWGN
jgi:tetratricopeptide (TPR) repeat protein